MSEITVGHWYKHSSSAAYGRVLRISLHTVRVAFDNGFVGGFPKRDFWEHFKVTTQSEKMNKKGENK